MVCLCDFYYLGAAEPRIQILSPKDGAQIAEDQKTILISGKVASDNVRSANVDIFLILDTSGSTVNSAGAEFANQTELPDKYRPWRRADDCSRSFRFLGAALEWVRPATNQPDQSTSFDSWR